MPEMCADAQQLIACCVQAYGYDYSAYGYPGYYDPADPYAGYYAGAYGQQYDPNAASTVGEPWRLNYSAPV